MPPKPQDPKAPTTIGLTDLKAKLKDPAALAASKKFVLDTIGDQEPEGNTFNRQCGLILDVLLFGAVVVNEDADLGKVRVAYKDGIKRPKIVAPRYWQMEERATGEIIQRLHAAGIPFTLAVVKNGTNVSVGDVKNKNQRKFTVPKDKELYRPLVVEVAKFVLAEAKAG